MLEEIPEEEYKEYIERLKKKDIYKMDYNELSDLTMAEFEDDCDNKDWKKLRTGLRLLSLLTNNIEAKADATKTILMKLSRGEKVDS